MKLPNFLIVGAAKCGTTSLYEYLCTHPQVFMPTVKEPAYFAPEGVGISSWQAYCALFDTADRYPRVGEASVSYLTAPEAPYRIEQALGRDIQIIVLLRNPVDMAYSLWGHEVREGVETMSFAEAIRDEPRRISDPAYARSIRSWVADTTYLARARYGEQVLRYLNRFGRNHLHVFVFEEFFRPGLPLYPDLCRTLQIDPDHRPVEEAHNKAGTVRSAYMRRVLTERMAWKEPFKRVLPSRIRSRLMSALARFNRIERALPPVPEDGARMIEEGISEDIDLLSRLLGRDFRSIWKLGAEHTSAPAYGINEAEVRLS